MHTKYRFVLASLALWCRCQTHSSWNVSNDDRWLWRVASEWPSLCSFRAHSPSGSKMVHTRSHNKYTPFDILFFFPKALPIKIGFQLFVCCCMFASQWLDCWRFHGQWRPNYFPLKFVALLIPFPIQWQIFWCSWQFKCIGKYHLLFTCFCLYPQNFKSKRVFL